MHENQSPVPLPRYRSHKVVEAAKILSSRMWLEAAGCRWLTLEGVKDAVEVTAEWYDRHKVQPGGYFVRYADGYTSFSPAAAFEEGYSPVTQIPCDERDSLRHELACMQIQLRASTRAESELRQQLKAASDKRSEALVKQLDELRRECSDLRQALAASPEACDVLFKADMQEAMSGKRPPMEQSSSTRSAGSPAACRPMTPTCRTWSRSPRRWLR